MEGNNFAMTWMNPFHKTHRFRKFNFELLVNGTVGAGGVVRLGMSDLGTMPVATAALARFVRDAFTQARLGAELGIGVQAERWRFDWARTAATTAAERGSSWIGGMPGDKSRKGGVPRAGTAGLQEWPQEQRVERSANDNGAVQAPGCGTRRVRTGHDWTTTTTGAGFARLVADYGTQLQGVRRDVKPGGQGADIDGRGFGARSGGRGLHGATGGTHRLAGQNASCLIPAHFFLQCMHSPAVHVLHTASQLPNNSWGRAVSARERRRFDASSLPFTFGAKW
ncbi:hypothetical protein MVEN_00459200 [Mycena venus]|uniref:Uncharacterized protein n=1 Tax=Mycena venus TaxID=2733690 RepID=A0A8H6YV85_9AGAR|nr:hypothetical protein MVEN_00459200 [Mycena venus]